MSGDIFFSEVFIWLFVSFSYRRWRLCNIIAIFCLLH